MTEISRASQRCRGPCARSQSPRSERPLVRARATALVLALGALERSQRRRSDRAPVPGPRPARDERNVAEAVVRPEGRPEPKAIAGGMHGFRARQVAARSGVKYRTRGKAGVERRSWLLETLLFRIAGRNQLCRPRVSVDAASPREQRASLARGPVPRGVLTAQTCSHALLGRRPHRKAAACV